MWARFVLAGALLEAGDAPRARDELLDASGDEQLTRLPTGWRPSAFELLTRAMLGSGSPEQAAVAAENSASASQGLPMHEAIADRAAAAVALDVGDTAAAAERALRSAAACADVGSPVEAALSRMLAGRALAQAGERERAAAEFTSAAGAFESCGALPRRDGAELELGKLGRRVHRRTRAGKADGTGIETLTERELEVARLVMDRLDERTDRGRAVPQPEDRRDPYPASVSEARGVLPGGGGARGGARGARGTLSQIRVPDQGFVPML